MLPTAREVLRLAEESGFEGGALEKVIRMAELLAAIEEHDVLNRCLALKGGTALNLFFGVPGRLSVDLDFNFTGAEQREEMLAMRPQVENRLQAIARGQGYGVQESAAAHAGRKLFLSFNRLTNGQLDRLEVDVNFLHRVCLLPTERRSMWRPDGNGPTTTLVSWPEIAAGKLVALLDRAAPRDAWDVSRLPMLSPSAWPPPDLRRMFLVIAGTLPHPLPEYGQHSLARITESDVSRLLPPLLIGGEQPSAEALRRGAWSVLAPLLALTEQEREYFDRLAHGDLKPQLLFPDTPDLAARVGRHPGLLWKAQHAGQHARRGRPTV